MSTMIEHAKKELKMLGGSDEPMQQAANKDILDLIDKLVHQGHSRFSANYVINIFEELSRYLPLQPLTEKNSTFTKSCETCAAQNDRCSGLFKNVDGTYEYINAIIFSDNYGKTCYTTKNGHVQVTLPFMPRKEFLHVYTMGESNEKNDWKFYKVLDKKAKAFDIVVLAENEDMALQIALDDDREERFIDDMIICEVKFDQNKWNFTGIEETKKKKDDKHDKKHVK